MRKPVLPYADNKGADQPAYLRSQISALVVRCLDSIITICEQQRCRSAWAFAQSDQHLCCSLPGQYNTSSFYIRNFKPLPSFCGSTGSFESTLVANVEDRFSRDKAYLSGAS